MRTADEADGGALVACPRCGRTVLIVGPAHECDPAAVLREPTGTTDPREVSDATCAAIAAWLRRRSKEEERATPGDSTRADVYLEIAEEITDGEWLR